jgi:hypothetical protein
LLERHASQNYAMAAWSSGIGSIWKRTGRKIESGQKDIFQVFSKRLENFLIALAHLVAVGR